MSKNYNSTLQSNNTSLQAIIDDLNNIGGLGGNGTDTSDATATANEIFAGETAYVADGKVTGTFTIENEITAQNDLISQIATALEGKAAGGSETPIEMCTVTFESTNSSYNSIRFLQYVTIDSDGKAIGVALSNTDLTNSFSIQCVCNTCINGIFPPTLLDNILYTNCTRQLSAGSASLGTFFWGRLTALPGETATFTFN